MSRILWWRDDDAMRDTRQLRRLIAISERHRAPLTIASVAMRFDDSLVQALSDAPEWITVCVHGADHRNRADPGEDRSEFPDSRDPDEAIEAIATGWRRVRDAFGARAIPVLAPPWNRVSGAVRARLPTIGLALSDARTVHIDPICWSRRRSLLNGIRHRLFSEPGPRPFAGAGTVASQIREAPAHAGLMTHHRAHDRACWAWLDRFLAGTPVVSFQEWIDGRST